MDSRRPLQLYFGSAVLLAVVALAAGLSRPAPAHGATFVVATTTDAYDVTPGNGVCQGVLGFPCSLRAAIQEANALAGPDVITLPAGTYNLTRSGVGEDNASTGDLDINPNPDPIVNQDLTINGAGAGTTIIDAQDLDRVFHVISRTVSISGVTIRNGNIGGSGSGGGGIYNSGTLTLTDSTVSGNTAGADGGAIYNYGGTVTLTNSTVSGNTGRDGGAIYNYSGTLMLTNSTVSGNIANVSGGGISNLGSLTLTNSTVNGNTAAGGGGGISNLGTVTLSNSTVSGNETIYFFGGGIYNSGTLTLTNSTVSGNEATYVDGGGGGIYNSGTVTLTNSTFIDNEGGGIWSVFGGNVTFTNSTVSWFHLPAPGSFPGNGIYNDGTMNLTNSTVSGNISSGSGGGIFNSGTLTLTNSTVSGNTAHNYGGGFYNVGTLTLTNSTITDNTADRYANDSGDGGGIANYGAVNLKNTIVAANFDLSNVTVEPDCVGALISQGYNLIQTVSVGCSISGDATGNITGQAADLAPLANNGGPTQTHAILAGSPAIDAGSLDCPPPATDQRGVGRPLGSGCDIGAYESPFGCTDDDSDGVCNSADNCPTTANQNQANQDNDLAGDACEPAHCVAVPNWWSSPSPALDPDCDGFTTTIESDPDIGTDPNDPCANTEGVGDETDDKWPVDFTDNRIVNTLDLTGYASRMNTVPVTALDRRHDLNQNGVINTLDLTPYATMLGRSCA